MIKVGLESLSHVESPPSDSVCWDDNLSAFLADEQLRLHRKKHKWHGEDETDDWLAEFEKLALLELRK